MPKSLFREGPRIPSLILLTLFAASLFGGIFAIYVNLQSERRERDQVQLTSDIMFSLRVAGRALIDAETGQRGYVITGDPAYLAPYYRGSRDWPGAHAQLEKLLAPVATPRQAQLLKQAGELGKIKLAELEATVTAIEDGDRPDAIRRVTTDDGRETMVEYRRAIGELEEIERKILSRANQDAQRVESRVLPILVLLALLLVAALALGVWQVFRIARAEAEARTASSLAEARDRADLLSRELNHRVKNIFAVIQAIVRMSLRGDSDTEVAMEKVSRRINALSVAHSVTQGELETPVANLQELIRTATAPYLSEGNELVTEGPETVVIARQVTPLGLILHELVTNCVKYGAWSQPGGALAVKWSHDEANEQPIVVIDWAEQAEGLHPHEGPEGFGTRMIVASARQLGGDVERIFEDDGLRIRLRFHRAEA